MNNDNDKTSNTDYEDAMRVLGGGKRSDLAGNLNTSHSDVQSMSHEQRTAELFVNTSIAVGTIGAEVMDHFSGHLADAPLTDLNGAEGIVAGEDQDAIQHVNIDDLSGGSGGDSGDGGLGPTGGV